MTASRDRPPTEAAITRNTRVTIGAVASVAVILVGTFNLVNNRFKGIEDKLDEFSTGLLEITFNLRGISKSIEDLSSDHAGFVRKRDMEAWVEVLRARNPELDAPDFDT